MSISFNGFSNKVLTFNSKETDIMEKPVKVTKNGYVEVAVAGNDICGVCVTQRDDICGVQVEGYIELPYTSTAPTLNRCSLVADGTGGVKVSAVATNRCYTVLNVDTENKIVGFIL